ncbi:MAG: hypothetical protein IIZ66_02410, partial [Clostridia bacterium]|nr:hypothetical protein [Clostridia bacterium]
MGKAGRALSVFLSVVMALGVCTASFGWLGEQFRALALWSSTTPASNIPGAGGTLYGGNYYKVTSNTNITGGANQAGLYVASGAIVVIDIAPGVTLTVTGGNGSGGSSGGGGYD